MGSDVTFPPNTPVTHTGRELGIMFGFIGLCLLTMGIYFVLWQVAQRREAAQDKARREELRARGFHHERGGIHEKMLQHFTASPRDNAQNHYPSQQLRHHSLSTGQGATGAPRSSICTASTRPTTMTTTATTNTTTTRTTPPGLDRLGTPTMMAMSEFLNQQ